MSEYGMVRIAVPEEFDKVIFKAAIREGLTYSQKLLEWARAGAEHNRLCVKRENHTRRKRK